VYTAIQDGRQRSQDFEIGFWSGAIHTFLTRRRVLNKSEQELTAYDYFLREIKLGALWREDFIQSWQAGYKAYFDGFLHDRRQGLVCGIGMCWTFLRLSIQPGVKVA